MEDSCWFFLCCCCCCCCILPTAILVPLAAAGVFAGTVVQEDLSATVNLTTVTTTLGEVTTTETVEETTTEFMANSTSAEFAWSPFAPAPPPGEDEENSTLCEDDEILIYENVTDENSTDENSTNVTRCEKKPKKKSKKWIVRITYIELVFNWMGEISYYTSIGALICGATQIGLALLSSFCCCPEFLLCILQILEIIVATFFGLIYIGYFITVPLFGWPEGDSFFYPQLPHVGPPPPEEVEREESGMARFIIKTIFAVRNSIFLALVLYMLMMSIMVFLGSLLVIPSVCFFMGILVGLTRLADSVVRMLAKDLDTEFNEEMLKEMQKQSAEGKINYDDVKEQADKHGERAMNMLKGGNVGKDANDAVKEFTGVAQLEEGIKDLQNKTKQAMGMLEQVGGFITIPWWDNSTKDYFKGMDTPSETCMKMGTCALDCKSFFLTIFHFLIEIPELLVTVGLPSFVKFNFDILFLLTVLGGFSVTMPAFKFDLPNVDLGISALIPAFDLFNINLPSLPPTYIPEWEGHCRATSGLGLILNLIGSTFTAIVVISSDILSCLYDRQSRIKLLKAAQKQKDKAHEKDEDDKTKDHEKKGCCQRISDKISDLRNWIKAVKASIYTGLVEVSTFAVLFSIGLIVNQATVFLVRLILEMGAPNSDDGQKPDGWAPCTVGVYGLSKILAVLAMFATLSYAYRVLSGHVHKDGIYILGAALVQEEKICQLVSLKRLVAIVRVCSFALILPFLSLGLQAKHLDAIGTNLQEKRGSLDRAVKKIKTGENQFKFNDEQKLKKVESDVVETAKRLTEFQGSSSDLTAVKRSFAARSAMTSCLFDLALNERGEENQMLIERKNGHSDLRNVNDFHLLEFTECCKKMEKKRTTWYGPFLAMLGAPFGRMSNEDAIANRMAERCCIWQAQAESVHRASSYIHGIVLFLIPVGGTVAGKGLQVMSDAPGLFTAKEKEICEYSFYQEKGEDKESDAQIKPSIWRRIAYFIGILRVVCSVLTISLRKTPVFWAMSQTNSALAMAQERCKRKDDEENKTKIAKKYEDAMKAMALKAEAREANPNDEISPEPQKVGGQEENNGTMPPITEQEDGNLEDVQDEVDPQEVEPQFNFSDEEAPSSPQAAKAKAKPKKSKVKAKGKAKTKAKAKPKEEDLDF